MKPTPDEIEQIRQDGLAADRLRTDPGFQRAVIEIRKDAVDKLIALAASDTENNIRLRAEIKAIDALCGSIAFSIERGKHLPQE